MAIITSLSVRLNRSHFSKYEPARAIVKATVLVTPSTGLSGSDQVKITLRRRTISGERTLDEQTVTVPTAVPDGLTAEFDLRQVVDADGFNAARLSADLNDYRIFAEVVEAVPPVSAEKAFTVVLITAEEMRSRWLLGLPLLTAERLAPRLQPQAVTGITVLDVGMDTPQGPGILAFTKGPPKTLAWAGGSEVEITPGVSSYVLVQPGEGYLVVEVEANALPANDTEETLHIGPGEMTEEAIIGDIMDLTQDVEVGLQVFLEPTKVASRHLLDPRVAVPAEKRPTEYDTIGDGVAWYKPADAMRWIAVKLPFHSVLYVKELVGYFNLQRAVEINRDWITWTEKTGLVELVPSNLAVINWIFYGIGFYTFFSTYGHVPQFWQFQITAGFRECPVDVVNFIARRAAIAILAKAGQARYPAGVGGYSLARDGVSESRSLNPTGIYAATIKRYERETGSVETPDGRDPGLQRLRDKYRGLPFVTL